MLTQEMRMKLNHSRPRPPRVVPLVADPAMRQVGPDQHQIALFETRRVVADETNAAALRNERELDLGMKVPATTEALPRDFHHPERLVASESDLLERCFHAYFEMVPNCLDDAIVRPVQRLE